MKIEFVLNIGFRLFFRKVILGRSEGVEIRDEGDG